MSAKVETVVVGAVLLVGLGAAWWVLKRGGVQNAAQALTSGAIRAADGVAAGVVGGIGATVGLPTPSQTVTDPAQARYLIDVGGYFFASRWSSAYALARGAMLPAWSGTPPLPGTPAHTALLLVNQPSSSGDFARLDRETYYDTSGRAGSNGEADMGQGTGYYDPMGGFYP